MSRARNKPVSPASRPLRFVHDTELASRFEQALLAKDGVAGAHCIHERWMRGAMAVHIESALERLWQHAATSIPEWLPTRHFDWLALAYETCAQFTASKRGRSNIYLVLLDYSDSRAGALRRIRRHEPLYAGRALRSAQGRHPIGRLGPASRTRSRDRPDTASAQHQSRRCLANRAATRRGVAAKGAVRPGRSLIRRDPSAEPRVRGFPGYRLDVHASIDLA